MSGSNKTIVSSPGRICLFGEHQDYLGLPVIAAAVNVRARFEAERNGSGLFEVSMPDIGAVETIDPSVVQEYRSGRDYMRSAVNVMRRRGYRFGQGCNIKLTSGIPIGKGCSSSSAILVAWIGLLSRIATEGAALAPEEAAQLGYIAEVKEFNEPGGMMDHYTSALGGLVHIETKGEIKIHPLPAKIKGVFILGDSLEPKDTTGVLGSVRGNAVGGMDRVEKAIPDAAWESLDLAAAEPALRDVPEVNRRAVIGNLKNRDLTRAALRILSTASPDPAELGGLLFEEQNLLRDYIGISTRKIDSMVSAAMEAGAWGAKINGSGGGGCMFAYCDGKAAAAVAGAIDAAGGRAKLIHIDKGMTEETE
jgi:galactokinase